MTYFFLPHNKAAVTGRSSRAFSSAKQLPQQQRERDATVSTSSIVIASEGDTTAA